METEKRQRPAQEHDGLFYARIIRSIIGEERGRRVSLTELMSEIGRGRLPQYKTVITRRRMSMN